MRTWTASGNLIVFIEQKVTLKTISACLLGSRQNKRGENIESESVSVPVSRNERESLAKRERRVDGATLANIAASMKVGNNSSRERLLFLCVERRFDSEAST